MLAAAPRDNLGSEHRAALYDAVRRWPGMHLADLARRAGLPDSLARYHMRLLVKAGLVSEAGGDGPARYFLEDVKQPVVDRRDRDALAVLRRPVPLQIALLLLASETGAMVMSELAAAAGVAPATATYHVQKMKAAGLVAVQAEGRQHRVTVPEAGRLRSLLTHNPPPQDIVQGFMELWDRLEL